MIFALNCLFITSAILCLLYLVGYSRFGKSYKIFTVYITVSLIMDLVATNLWDWFKIQNTFTAHFYDLFQFIILSFFYATLLRTEKQLQAVRILLIILPIFLLSRYVFNPQMFFEYSPLETYLAVMPLIVYTTMHLYNNLEQKTEFYFANLGLMLYLFGSTFVFLFFELNSFFEKSATFYINLAIINLSLQFIKFGFFFYQWKLIYFNKDGKYN